ncbi:MAG: L-threonine 3-dehydrogenase [Armatimonadota bacterium]
MEGKMKAVVKTKPAAGAELIEVDIPKIKDDEVLVKVQATSICGTDVHIYNWNKWAEGRIKNIPQVLGHEFAGEVVEVGKNVKNIKVGDYISAETHIPCLMCKPCLTGQQHICSNLKILGVDCNGCFAEYAAVPEVVCWKNSKDIPPEFASVQEPLGNAVYTTLVEDVAGKSVVIIGEGPTGLFAAGVARIAGATDIFMVGKHPYRMDIAKKMGADHLLFLDKCDVVKEVMDKTDGIGADVVLEMAGSQQAIEDGFKMVRKGGRFSAFGLPGEPLKIDYSNGIVFKGVTVYGINGRLMYDTWFRVRNLLKSKRLDISPVVTHKLPLSEFKKGFDLMTTRPKVCGKVVLIP